MPRDLVSRDRFRRSRMTGQEGEGETETDPAISTIHHSLRAPRRRFIVELVGQMTFLKTQIPTNSPENEYLEMSQDGAISARQLARSIVAIENEVTPENARGKEYHAAYTALVQTHLPQLDDAGIVEFDADRKMIRPGTNLLLAFVISCVTVPLVHRFFFEDDIRFYDRTKWGDPSVTDL